MRFLIVGQGLAGTTLSWRLIQAGHDVVIMDPFSRWTSSIVAAGLMTPITGKDLTPSWRYVDLLDSASKFYKSIEEKLSKSFFRRIGISRVFVSNQEKELFQVARDNSSFNDLVQSLPSIPKSIKAPLGGFYMPNGAQLDVKSFILSSRDYFIDHKLTQQKYFDFTRLSKCQNQLSYDGEKYDGVALCRGFYEGILGDINFLQFEPNRGQMLRLKCPSLEMSDVWNQRGLWMVQEKHNDSFLIGATYHRLQTQTYPSIDSFNQIWKRLNRFVQLPNPYNIQAHLNGIRPIIRGWKLVAGHHPNIPNLFIFNGLGSKGALRAPEFSLQLSRSMEQHIPTEKEVNLAHIVL